MYEQPSLLKTAYYACNKIERNKFDLLETPNVKMSSCCELLFEFLKINKNLDEGNDRQTMFSRSQFRINDERFKYICEQAAIHGHIDCMKLAHKVGVPWVVEGWRTVFTVCDRALEMGHTECLKYAFENGCRWGLYTCVLAAMYGRLECLVYARENGCRWDENTCAFAAMRGHLDCLVYARENGCPWNERTCFSAEKMGHLDCLAYARENGCPWDKDLCNSNKYLV
ncbi:uncharacterized protein LOC100159826 [Acyrthosiphon pisum]|uniref:Uncharacterized protein n=1 Tax=Acyrthosiphon pisum TaxID=7029 RepID=A0A8R1W5E3_ACYPI|nr:uncharacterized protein LOC100159826 [Acyrthosiphon pisum]|eukprot:XP_003243597.1 PREDICTED: uncharacterized protein LOC100159826 [Acyrthosiphon pisum]